MAVSGKKHGFDGGESDGGQVQMMVVNLNGNASLDMYEFTLTMIPRSVCLSLRV